MKRTTITAGGISIPLLILDTAVVGSGCAGFNAADWLYDLGRTDVAILTEGVNCGTSRNTGSDKQTYYKLSLASDGADSVGQMAQDLFDGEGVNGDTALAEAANSVRSFIKLANLGVPFPTNIYGEYVGYQTDHDVRQRATSAGPLTSRFMTECLERSVMKKGIPVLDGMTVVEILTRDGQTEGLICLDRAAMASPSMGLTIVRAKQVIWATGGPAGCYADSVYPESQTGMSGAPLMAGAQAANLQEWQYGLASTKFRWNVSGTYQQVLPRYISVDENGVEREFLKDALGEDEALNLTFLKGYQWPFDSTKINGSSKVDILVYHETADLHRKVYLDFTRNPSGLEQGFGLLSDEAYRYLKNSDAMQETPIARLEKMNRPAIELYRTHGINLYREPLEIAVCAQHHNGGLAVDLNWQTSVKGLYVCGEAAGTFGVHRPGGSALNSTQVGSLKAAENIAYTTKPENSLPESFLPLAQNHAENLKRQMEKACAASGGRRPAEELRRIQTLMSRCAAHIREKDAMESLTAELTEILNGFWELFRVENPFELIELLKARDLFRTQLAVLSAMRCAAERVGSRGASLIRKPNGELTVPELPEYVFDGNHPLPENLRMVTVKSGEGFLSRFEPVRELPHPDNWFETVWGEYRSRTGK